MVHHATTRGNGERAGFTLGSSTMLLKPPNVGCQFDMAKVRARFLALVAGRGGRPEGEWNASRVREAALCLDNMKTRRQETVASPESSRGQKCRRRGAECRCLGRSRSPKGGKRRYRTAVSSGIRDMISRLFAAFPCISHLFPLDFYFMAKRTKRGLEPIWGGENRGDTEAQSQAGGNSPQRRRDAETQRRRDAETQRRRDAETQSRRERESGRSRARVYAEKITDFYAFFHGFPHFYAQNRAVITRFYAFLRVRPFFNHRWTRMNTDTEKTVNMREQRKQRETRIWLPKPATRWVPQECCSLARTVVAFLRVRLIFWPRMKHGSNADWEKDHEREWTKWCHEK
jgi:hypothetical protein